MDKSGIIVLMYHAVVKNRQELNRLDPEDRPYAVSLDGFCEQMAILRKAGVSSVTVSELVSRNRDEGFPPDTVVLTFDDGYDDLYTNAYPVLEENGLSATCFIATGRVDREPYLGWDQIKELADRGLHVGSHTVNHPFLSDLDDDGIRRELSQSKSIIEEKTGQPVKTLSLPGGRQTENIIGIARSVGFQGILTSVPGITAKGDLPWNIKRVPVRPSLAARDFRRIISRDEALLKGMVRSFQFKNRIKGILGHRLYHALYRLVPHKQAI